MGNVATVQRLFKLGRKYIDLVQRLWERVNFIHDMDWVWIESGNGLDSLDEIITL